MLNAKHSILLIIITISFGCGRNGRSDLIEYEKPLQDLVNAEVKRDLSKDSKTLLFILHASDCSCKEANVLFAKKISANNRFKGNNIFILKDDKKMEVLKKINYLSPDIVIMDTTNLLERYGNFYATDKVFVFDKGNLSRIYTIEKDRYNEIESDLRGK